MDAQTYMSEFKRTLATTFHPDSVSPSWLECRILERQDLARRLKTARNALFYGKRSEDQVMANDLGERFGRKPDLLHALLGLDGEAFEMLELAASQDDGDDLRQRVVEEAGDALYFVALALSAVGADLEEAMEKNISKVRARYPGKFSNARYLAGE